MIKTIQRLARKGKSLEIMHDGDARIYVQLVENDFGQVATFVVCIPLERDVTFYTWSRIPKHRWQQVGMLQPWDRLVIHVAGHKKVTHKRVPIDTKRALDAVQLGTRAQRIHTGHTVTGAFPMFDALNLDAMTIIE